ncbi:hypothetical protein U1Q18_019311 [Sarracenia purpurea var. burkii]
MFEAFFCKWVQYLSDEVIVKARVVGNEKLGNLGRIGSERKREIDGGGKGNEEVIVEKITVEYNEGNAKLGLSNPEEQSVLPHSPPRTF